MLDFAVAPNPITDGFMLIIYKQWNSLYSFMHLIKFL